MSGLTDNLDAIAEQIRLSLSAKDAAREKALPLCREVIRYSSQAIRAVHRQEFDRGKESLQSARGLLDEAAQALADSPEFVSAGFLRDAEKEYAEGSILLALVTGKQTPGPGELRVDSAAYLNGLGEAVGELRRYLLDSMRGGDLSRGEELLSAMDDIYNVLVTIDFPDAITGGLRRTTDVVRGVLEKTRSDLTLAIRQGELEKRLKDFQERGVRGIQPSEIELDSGEPAIYEALRNWRNQKAREEKVAPFVIAHNSWLKQIVKLHPAAPEDLLAIKGFGEKRAESYGKEILAVLRASRSPRKA
ncbi:MAG: HRDC domain-containing protein [Dehalococcoidales bacterium]|nr:HRDC domain-containing protein [Dehalococcoidales bacterium]